MRRCQLRKEQIAAITPLKVAWAFRTMPQNNANAERFARDLEHLIQPGSLPA